MCGRSGTASSPSTSCPKTRVDAFLVKPVNVSPGYFDDRTLAGQTLWGVHVSASPKRSSLPVKITAFYYGNTMPEVQPSIHEAGKEQTHTVGLRLLASERRPSTVRSAASGQVGTFGDDRSVLAWAAHARCRLDARRAMEAAFGAADRHSKRRSQWKQHCSHLQCALPELRLLYRGYHRSARPIWSKSAPLLALHPLDCPDG